MGTRKERHISSIENADTDEQVTRRIEQAEPARETVPVANTSAEEEREFRSAHDADRPPTPEEEALAEEHGPLDPAVAARVEQAAKAGANVRGEGEIR